MDIRRFMYEKDLLNLMIFFFVAKKRNISSGEGSKAYIYSFMWWQSSVFNKM